MYECYDMVTLDVTTTTENMQGLIELNQSNCYNGYMVNNNNSNPCLKPGAEMVEDPEEGLRDQLVRVPLHTPNKRLQCTLCVYRCTVNIVFALYYL